MSIASVSRRRALAALALTPVVGACSSWFGTPAPERGPVALALTARMDDGGFGQAAYQGLQRVRYSLGLEVEEREAIPPDGEAVLAALRELARGRAPLIIVGGDATGEATQRAAWEFPKKKFALLDGTLTRPNLAVYRLLPEQSAWLAGAAAGMVSRSGVVAHLGGEPTPEAQRLRAAFADGVRNTAPKARLLTAFVGEGAEPARALLRRVRAEGADVAFAPLPSPVLMPVARDAQAAGVQLIGARFDWVDLDPAQFVASAVADPGALVVAAARDLRDNVFVGDVVREFGLRRPEAVRLAMSPDLPATVRDRIAGLAAQVGSGRIAIPQRYDGPELRVTGSSPQLAGRPKRLDRTA